MTTSYPKACVIGHPIAHSRSPMIHRYWLKTLGIAGDYELADVAPENFTDFFNHMRANGFVGGNVTVPHKEAAYKLVASMDDAAQKIGAVNTIWVEDGKLVGGNSDGHGFIRNLDEGAPGGRFAGEHVVILGAGGAARSAIYALLDRAQKITIVNRTAERASALAAHFGPKIAVAGWDQLVTLLPQADLLVNCTALGMMGKPAMEIDITGLKKSATVYDVVYVPLETDLLAAARKQGHRVVDGLGMLLYQAGFGFNKWFGVTPEVTKELRALVEADIVAKTTK